MKDRIRLIVALVAGYYLGRRHKMRWALTLAAAGAAGRLPGPGAVMKQGAQLLGSSAEVKTLTDTVRGRLVEAGKVAAVTAANSQIDALSDKLQKQTDTLLHPAGKRPEEERDRGEERPAEPRRPSPSARRPEPAGRDDRRETARRHDEREDDRPRRSASGSPVRRTRR